MKNNLTFFKMLLFLMTLGILSANAHTSGLPTSTSKLSGTAPTTPNNLRVSNVTSTSAHLQWGLSRDRDGDLDTYFGKEANNRTSFTNGFAQFFSSRTITGLTPNTTYRFRIQARDRAGNASGFSREVSFTTRNDANFTGVNRCEGLPQQNLSRNNSGDTFFIRNSEMIERLPNVFGTISRGSCYVSSAGTAKSQQKKVASAPTAPTNLRVSDVTSTSAHLQWDLSRDRDGDLDTYFGKEANNRTSFTNGFAQFFSSRTITGLTPNTTYRFRIQARDKAGNASGFSREVSFTTRNDANFTGVNRCEGLPQQNLSRNNSGDTFFIRNSEMIERLPNVFGTISRGSCYVSSTSETSANSAPTTPTNLRASNITSSSFTLSWDASSDPNGDFISYFGITNNNKVYFNSPGKNATQVTMNGMSANTTFVFRVRAEDRAGNQSNFSEEISVTTLRDTSNDTVNCQGIPFWDPINGRYRVGDRVIRNGNEIWKLHCCTIGWVPTGDKCSEIPTSDLCEGVKLWQRGVRYRTGDKVIYQGRLWKLLSNGRWENKGDCSQNGSSKSTATAPPSANNIVLFQNPVANELNTSFDNPSENKSTYSIVNLNGRIVAQGTYKPSLNVSELPKGMYILRVSANNTILSSTFIKK
ncbi:fibronectin type III domain-containing protein [Aquimarina sp. 2201CG1-2-11]|uniref:T9SS type A sorting domain-containing protein n=1 Tax=Aquimarina discodermiae TaxID=3231043 RepID=UPI0034633774